MIKLIKPDCVSKPLLRCHKLFFLFWEAEINPDWICFWFHFGLIFTVLFFRIALQIKWLLSLSLPTDLLYIESPSALSAPSSQPCDACFHSILLWADGHDDKLHQLLWSKIPTITNVRGSERTSIAHTEVIHVNHQGNVHTFSWIPAPFQAENDKTAQVWWNLRDIKKDFPPGHSFRSHTGLTQLNIMLAASPSVSNGYYCLFAFVGLTIAFMLGFCVSLAGNSY